MVIAAATIAAPEIDYAGLAPLFATAGGSIVVLLTGLVRGRLVQRVIVPLLSAVVLLAAIGLAVWNWQPGDAKPIVEGALAIDTLAFGMAILFYVAGLCAILLSLRESAVGSVGAGEYFALMLASISGMTVLAGAESLVTLFVGLELLSIPLYVLCAGRLRRATSLESGLKYLIVGSVGSATLLYGLALLYGATGTTDFGEIAAAAGKGSIATDSLFLAGTALAAAGLAFKASVAPFHQWTPDVYEGAPTPITALMAVATKAAAFAIIVRFFDQALIAIRGDWAPALAALALTTIVVGNVGAIGQSSLKRMLAWSGVAQAGYLLAGVVVGTRLGLQATAFYLAAYLAMNMAAFAVVSARERVSEHGDRIDSLEGLGRASPWLAWAMTIAMLALAGFPATAGFIGKLYLIDAAVAGGYQWLGVAIVVGSMVSLAYYLRVVAVIWMGPGDLAPAPATVARAHPATGGSAQADAAAQPETVAVALLAAAATVFFGIVPAPLFDAARDVGSSLAGLG